VVAETIKKILRAQEIAMRQRIPIVYLVDSAGVTSRYQVAVLSPAKYGAARIFYYNSIMRHYLRVPQIARGHGTVHCGRGVPARPVGCDLHVEGTSFMGWGARTS